MTAEELRPIVERIIQETLPDAFLVSIKVNIATKSSVQIFVDTDAGITIEQCSLLSREIGRYFDEHNLFDFSYELEISSPGLNNPLILPRQYSKNIGRDIKVLLKNGEKWEGKLAEFNPEENKIQVEVLALSSHKTSAIQKKEFYLVDIKEAKIQVGKKKEKKK